MCTQTVLLEVGHARLMKGPFCRFPTLKKALNWCQDDTKCLSVVGKLDERSAAHRESRRGETFPIGPRLLTTARHRSAFRVPGGSAQLWGACHANVARHEKLNYEANSGAARTVSATYCIRPHAPHCVCNNQVDNNKSRCFDA